MLNTPNNSAAAIMIGEGSSEDRKNNLKKLQQSLTRSPRKLLFFPLTMETFLC